MIQKLSMNNYGFNYSRISILRSNLELINKFKQELILKFVSQQALAIESYDNFLKLQWFCQSKNIKLVNYDLNKIKSYKFEIRENEKKKEIFLIRPEFLTTMQEEIEKLFAYDTEYKIDSKGVRFSET